MRREGCARFGGSDEVDIQGLASHNCFSGRTRRVLLFMILCEAEGMELKAASRISEN